ncbi:hypothetical protein MYCTH_2077546 [Thermothelomyces thermophilus ATCC 42464]|uniref:Uncharacterized protein n=1 Tax=Thermothelomyces thermophilus (strain ATCC 42464 / BCRC 31852 / DSM 1799) TaxID=573729 RepID=G2Q8A3_THET4|nr:uncharacterized protein MYCTH_2077546 [Thermothelomyces thermophilus ATCC 42464]AEO56206.1 hypothetical protein MYCTH_2077546 [Thermothelomyces thermophilus ATCC 42464]
MTPQIRIVVKDRGLFGPELPGKPFVASKAVQPVQQPPRSKRGDLAMLRLGLDIALEYFNSDGSLPISTLTTKARLWADRYFKGYPYASKRPTALLRTFPNLFNLNIEPHLRLVPRTMSPPSSPEPEGTSSRDLRRAERRAMNSEAFPEFAEPTLASDSEIDRIINLPNRRTAPATKPTMRVDAAMLRGSGLMSTLPEFLGQLARANLELETKLATNPESVRIELDEEQAASQQHVEMNLFSGLVEAQRRRHRRRIVLPGDLDLAVKPPGATQHDGSGQDSGSSGGEQSPPRETSDDEEDSGDETDASTSTTASLRANLKKRKAAASVADEDAEADSPPNKIRLHYHYPTPKLRHYDMKRRKLVSRPNPDAAPGDPFKALPDKPAAAVRRPAADESITVATTERPGSSGSDSSSASASSSSSTGPVPITRIRVPSRSPDGSRSSSPDRIIMLRHPVVPSATPSRDASEEPASSSSSSSSSGSSPGRRTKIKVVQRERPDAERRRLIEEVE